VYVAASARVVEAVLLLHRGREKELDAEVGSVEALEHQLDRRLSLCAVEEQEAVVRDMADDPADLVEVPEDKHAPTLFAHTGEHVSDPIDRHILDA
jgi:hypothetical protein